jgi:hypothetical protein
MAQVLLSPAEAAALINEVRVMGAALNEIGLVRSRPKSWLRIRRGCVTYAITAILEGQSSWLQRSFKEACDAVAQWLGIQEVLICP